MSSAGGPTGDPGEPSPRDETNRRDGEATVTGALAGSELPSGTLVVGRFRIERMLGVGGMGIVYLATDQSLGVPVAIKVLRMELAGRADAFERFRQELLLARQVSSPHVVRIHDIAHDGDRWLISMDFVDGDPLDKVLDRRGRLPLEEALHIARQIALGLAAAHARAVVHRDLKPSNVLIDRNADAYISDFGVARSLGASGLTQTGVVLGTPRYMSPEQAKAEPVDARSDLYALGLLLYEMLSGEVAFGAGTAAESLSQRLIGPPQPLSRHQVAAPAWVQRLLDRLLQPVPAHRFQNADEIVRAIDSRDVPRHMRHGPRSAGIALALTACGAVGWAIWRYHPPSNPPTPAAPDRVVILPVENQTGNPALDDALAGYAENLRQGLEGLPDVQVVDGERSHQALAQLGLPDTGVPDARRVLAELPARTLLRTRLLHTAAGFAFSGTLEGNASMQRHIDVAASSGLLDAGLRYANAVAGAIQPGVAFPADVLPANQAAMSDYGAGLRACRTSQLTPCFQGFVKASHDDPHYAAAFLALAEASFRTGHESAAASALKQGASLHPSMALAEPLRQWQAMLDGDTTQVVASLVRHLAQHPDDLGARVRMGWLQGEGGDPAAAIKTLTIAAERDPNDPHVAYLLGKYSIMHGDLRPAVDEHLVRALVLYKRARNAFGEAETVNALGNGFSRLGQTADAEEQYRKAVALRRALGDQRGVASSLRNLAQMGLIQGRFDEAQAQLHEARGLFATIGDAGGIAAVDNQIGLLAEERGRYPEALDAFRSALHEREQLGDHQGVAESLNNIGFAHYQLGDYDNARVFWKQALEAFGKVEDGNGIVRAQQNLGLLETAAGHWDAARKLLGDSLASALSQQMAEEAAVSRRNLGELEVEQGHFVQAADQLQRAGALFKDREDARGLADIGLLQAQLALACSDADGAARVLDALADALTHSSDEQRAGAALLRAQIALRRHDPAAMRAALAQADPLVAHSGILVLALQARALAATKDDAAISKAVEALGNVSLMLAWYRRVIAFGLDGARPDAAVAAYRKARDLLRAGDAADAFALQAAGAEALARSGDAAGAMEARHDAQSALAALRAGADEAQRARIDADPAIAAFERATAAVSPDARSSRHAR